MGTLGGLGWYGLDWQSAYEQEANAKAADYARAAANQKEQACIVVTGPEKANCEQKAQDEYELKRRDNERDYDDLVAQRRAALWASIMGIAALFGMLLSLVGVVLVYRTFSETKKTNLIAKTTQSADLRPWVAIEFRCVKTEITDRTITVNYEVTVRNIGKTVATNVTFRSTHYFLGEGKISFLRTCYSEFDDEIFEVGRTALIPGESITRPGSHVRAREGIPWAGEGVKFVHSVVAGSVVYKSQFDDDWHRTDRAALFGKKGDDWFDHGFLYDNDLSFGGDDVVVTAAVPGITT